MRSLQIWGSVLFILGTTSTSSALQPLTFDEILEHAVDLEGKCILICWWGRSDVVQRESDKFMVTLYDEQKKRLLAIFPRAGLTHIRNAGGQFVPHIGHDPRHRRISEGRKRAMDWQFWLSQIKNRARGYHIQQHYRRGVTLRPYAFGIIRNEMLLDLEGREIRQPVVYMHGISRRISDRGIVKWVW